MDGGRLLTSRLPKVSHLCSLLLFGFSCALISLMIKDLLTHSNSECCVFVVVIGHVSFVWLHYFDLSASAALKGDVTLSRPSSLINIL